MTDNVKEYIERLGRLAEAIETENLYLAEEIAYDVAFDLSNDIATQELHNEETD